MSVRRVLAVAQAQLRELLRRRTAMVMLVLLPLVFYWTSGSDRFAPTFATVGVGWAFAIMTLFMSLGMRSVAPRLGLLGFGAADQLIGRLLSSITVGASLAIGLWVYIGRDVVILDHNRLAMSLLFSLIGSISAGLLAGALIPREMEAMLFLIGMVGLQLVVDHDTLLAKILPLYAAERYSAEAVGWDPSPAPWQATLIVSAVMLVIAVLVTVQRSPRPVR